MSTMEIKDGFNGSIRKHTRVITLKSGLMLLLLMMIIPVSASYAHCDTMNGPVLTAARDALNTGDVKLILIWVQSGDEAEITDLFNKTLQLRKINPAVRELADKNFFENVVRIHRAGEGAPYTGIKETEVVEPPVAAADKALETGNPGEVMKMLNSSISNGVNEKFLTMMSRKDYDKDDVEAGREFIESYVIFMHYVEGIYNSVNTGSYYHNEDQIKTDHENHNAALEIGFSQAGNSTIHDHTTHLLIITTTLLIMIVQYFTSRKRRKI